MSAALFAIGSTKDVILDAYVSCNARVSLITGPLGSGKTTGSCQVLLRHQTEQEPNDQGVRPTRFVVVRNSYPELETTTIPSFKAFFFPEDERKPREMPDGDVLPPMPTLGRWYEGSSEPPHADFTYRLDDGTRVRSLVWFVALDRPADVKRLLGLEITGVWLSECAQLDKSIVDMLDLRHGRFPSAAQGRVMPSWHGMFGDTNKPDTEHWFYQLAEQEKPDGWAFFHQPGGVVAAGSRADGRKRWKANPRAENLANLPDGLDYYVKGVAAKRDDWINVFLANEYGFVTGGKPVHPDYVDSIHASEDMLIARPGLPLILGFDFGRCYDDETEVLTEEGWRLIRDVETERVRVATLSPSSFELEYTPASKVSFDWDGELVHFSGVNLDFRVTPEHRVPFTHRETPDRLHFASAADLSTRLTSHRYVQVATRGGWCGIVPERLPLGWSPSLYARFMGWWLSEGSCEKTGNRIAISQKKPSAELHAMLRETGLSWAQSGCAYRTGSPELAAYLRPLGLQPVRRMPRELIDLPPAHLLELVEAFTLGDGHQRLLPSGAYEHVVFSSSRALMDDFQEIAVRLGWATAMRWQAPQDSTMRDGRKIRGAGVHIVSFKKKAKRAEFLPGQVTRESYRGKIYCLTVPYHTLCIRRRGKVSWNGNTPACTVLQRLPEWGRWVALDEFVTDDMSATSFAPQLKKWLTFHFPGFEMRGWGDPAGDAAGQATDDTPIRILNSHGIPCRSAPTNNPLLRRAALDGPLTRGTMDGRRGFLLSPACVVLRKGLSGGWDFPRINKIGVELYSDQPAKNRFSHVCEALEYALVGEGEAQDAIQPATRRYGRESGPYPETAEM